MTPDTQAIRERVEKAMTTNDDHEYRKSALALIDDARALLAHVAGLEAENARLAAALAEKAAAMGRHGPKCATYSGRIEAPPFDFPEDM